MGNDRQYDPICIPFCQLKYPKHISRSVTGLLTTPQYCVAYRFFYHCFLALLPFTLLFLAFHLFVENCKWNFAGEGGSVPRPWPHTIYLPLIWFFSAAYAVPTVFLSQVRDEPDDIFRNVIERRDETSAQVCHSGARSNVRQDNKPVAMLLCFIVVIVIHTKYHTEHMPH